MHELGGESATRDECDDRFAIRYEYGTVTYSEAEFEPDSGLPTD